jgi:molecular chaperone DnaJ
MRDYYEILEISQNATIEEIKASYRRLAIRFHPDKNPGDRDAEEQFKQVSEAYQVLSDLEKRQLYDMYGHSGLAGMDVGGFSGFEDFFGSFTDIFDDFFNFGQPGKRADESKPGADLRHRVVVTLEDVARGVKASLEIERSTACGRCQGSGLEPGTRPQKCPRCQGRGKISQAKRTLKIVNTCPECRGTGTVITTPCTSCRGTGLVREQKQLHVRIPPGVDEGTRLRLRGEGEAGSRGGPPGDLYLEVKIAPHPLFTRQGKDLHYRAPLSFVEAALGTTIKVPSLTAQSNLEVPPGTQPGATFRVPGKGLPGLRGKGRGDLVVEIDLKTPTQLTPQQKELLMEFLRNEEAAEPTTLKGQGRAGEKQDRGQGPGVRGQ